MELISPMFNKSVTLTADQRNVSLITCLIWNFFASINLQFYNGASLLGTVALSASSSVQSISKSIDLTGVSVLTIKTSAGCIMLGSLNIDKYNPVKIQDENALLSSYLYSTDGGLTQNPIPQLIGANIPEGSIITFWET